MVWSVSTDTVDPALTDIASTVTSGSGTIGQPDAIAPDSLFIGSPTNLDQVASAPPPSAAEHTTTSPTTASAMVTTASPSGGASNPGPPLSPDQMVGGGGGGGSGASVGGAEVTTAAAAAAAAAQQQVVTTAAPALVVTQSPPPGNLSSNNFIEVAVQRLNFYCTFGYQYVVKHYITLSCFPFKTSLHLTLYLYYIFPLIFENFFSKLPNFANRL